MRAAQAGRWVLVGLAAGFAGCTFHHGIAVRYTPLLQAKRVADAQSPQAVVIGPFKDARTSAVADKERLNPISVHHIVYDTVGDVPQIVTNAFIDGFLKSGFTVPMAGDTPPAEPFLKVDGKLTRYAFDTKAGWSTVSVTADVEVEVTLVRRNDPPVVLPVHGTSSAQAKGGMGTDTMSNALDEALQDCVKKFLADERFLALVKA